MDGMRSIGSLQASEESETAPVEGHASLGAVAPPSYPEVTRVGRFVALEEVGRGGMGRVLRAYDPKLQREVALKQLRERALDDEGSARLVREARAMAKLSHANVVAIYDVEAREDGRLVIVMEYVAGTTLRTWLRERDRDWKPVVECFRAAGRGLAAAHAAGLLHRDFKPSNVLVSDEGTVKVTDFGLARGTGEAARSPGDSTDTDTAPESGSLTRSGVLLGTPRYMAPEQERSTTLTEAADQYAFCIALWEALCGEAPFRGKNSAAAKRKGPPAWPNPDVPRPIVAAISRGLAPDPQRRWPNMLTLLEALAFDPSSRRDRWARAVGGLLVLGAAGAGVQAVASEGTQTCSGARALVEGAWDDTRRSAAEAAFTQTGLPYADSVWSNTRTVLDDYASSWVEMHTETCEATTVRGEQSSEMMDLRMACLSQARVELDAVADVLATADAGVVRNAHELVDGLDPLARCADLEALREGVEPPRPDEAAQVEEIRRLVAQAEALTDAGRYAPAHDQLLLAQTHLDRVEYGPLRAEVALQRGVTLERLGEYEASEAALREALDSAPRWQQWDEMQAAASMLLYVVGCRLQSKEGLRYREAALGLADDDPAAEAAARNQLALALDYAFGNYEEAEAEFRRALELKEDVLGEEHPSVARTLANLASTLQAQGKYDEALTEHRRALELRERVLGPRHPDVASSMNGVGIALYQRGNYEDAEAQHRRALALRQESLGPQHPEVADSHANLGVALFEQGRYRDAEEQDRLALSIREATLGPDHPEVAKAINNLASTLYSLEEFDEALAMFRKALRLREARLGDDHPHVATGRNNLAHVLLRLGRADEALPLAEKAWERRSRDGIPEDRRADTAFVLARARWETALTDEGRDGAVELAELALRKYAAAGESDEHGATRVRAWLGEHGATAR